MPSPRPSPHQRLDPAPSTSVADTSRAELEVRLAAQRILVKHLRPGPDPATPAATYWEHIDLNLTGATLVDWTMRECHVRDVTFTRTQFTGYALFNKATVDGDAWFDEAEFGGHAGFYGTRFEQGVPAEIAEYMEPRAGSGASDGELTE